MCIRQTNSKIPKISLNPWKIRYVLEESQNIEKWITFAQNIVYHEVLNE